MRCYFLSGGHIVAADGPLQALSDEEAIVKARVLLSKRENPIETFEVWDQTPPMIGRHPPIAQEPASGRRWTSGWRRRNAMARGFDAEPMTIAATRSSAADGAGVKVEVKAQSRLIDPDQCALAAICDAGDVISQRRCAHAFGVRL